MKPLVLLLCLLLSGCVANSASEKPDLEPVEAPEDISARRLDVSRPNQVQDFSESPYFLNEADAAINPNEPSHLVFASRLEETVGENCGAVIAYVSTNGGSTWESTTFGTPFITRIPEVECYADPIVSWLPNNTAILGFINVGREGSADEGLNTWTWQNGSWQEQNKAFFGIQMDKPWFVETSEMLAVATSHGGCTNTGQSFAFWLEARQEWSETICIETEHELIDNGYMLGQAEIYNETLVSISVFDSYGTAPTSLVCMAKNLQSGEESIHILPETMEFEGVSVAYAIGDQGILVDMAAFEGKIAATWAAPGQFAWQVKYLEVNENCEMQSEIRNLCDCAGHQVYPQVEFDVSGVAHVAWFSEARIGAGAAYVEAPQGGILLEARYAYVHEGNPSDTVRFMEPFTPLLGKAHLPGIAFFGHYFGWSIEGDEALMTFPTVENGLMGLTVAQFPLVST